jgi:flagellin
MDDRSVDKEVLPMRINNNIMAFNAYRNLSGTSSSMGKSLEKLSSGFRINRAADDAAGLVKSEGLRAEVGGTKTAIRNAQDGISLVQTGEGALNEVHAMLQRMRNLAVSAANTATSDGVAEQAEVTELLAEIGNIGTNTNFSGDQVFSGSAKVFHVGANAGQTISVTVANLSSTQTGGVDISGITLTGTTANAAITTIDSAIAGISTQRSTLGATQNRLESTIRNLSVSAENLTAAESRIRDADMAEEMVTFTRNQILQQAGTAMLAQANQVPQSVLSLLR